MYKMIGAALLIAAFGKATAQNVTIGPVVGLNHSWISDVDNKQFNPGLNAGAFIIYSIDPHWGVGADVRFSMEGVKTKAVVGQVRTDYDVNLNYIRIPVKGIYFFGQKGNKFRPKIYAGPSLGLLAGGRNKWEVTNLSTDSKVTTTNKDVKDDYKTAELGVFAGVGFNYRIVPKGIWLNVDVNYNHGLTDITKGSSEHYNRGLTASVGVGFPLGTF